MASKKEKEFKGKFKRFGVFLLVVLIAILYYSAFIEPKMLIVKEYPIIDDKINDSHHGLKIVHFSDLHYGTTVKIKELEKIVTQINDLKPELIIFTGDLIDKSYSPDSSEIEKIVIELNKINGYISAYAVKGNHDYNNDFTEIIEKTSFITLKNSKETFYYNDSIPIQIIGLESKVKNKINVEKAFKNYEEGLYTILLTHEPDCVLDVDLSKVDLILSGHSHNGQIRIPFVGTVITVPGAKKYFDEKYIIKDSQLFISGGLGTSQLPFRLFNPPSINIYRLYNK